MAWTNSDYDDDDELDIPTPVGIRYLQGVVGREVLWNKSDIILDEQTLVSQPRLLLRLSTMSDDDNDNTGAEDTPPGSPPGTS